MKVILTTIVATCVMAGAATAQSANSGSTSGSSSSSGVIIEGSNIPNNTPNAGVVIGSAGNCYPGGGIGASGPGWGISLGGGRVDPECNVREEMAAIAALAGNTAALAHACKHDASMRATLVDLGICRIQTAGGTSDGTIDDDTVPARAALYTFCGLDDEDRLIVRIKRGLNDAERAEASAQCGRDFAANGKQNIHN